jgi:serpin B
MRGRPRFEEGVGLKIIAIVFVIAIALATAGAYVILSGEERGTPTTEVFVEPSLSSLDPSGATSSSVSELVRGANEFAFEIYRELAEENKNVFLSPYSIHTCLSMVYEGARGETEEEMREVLNLPGESGIRRPAFAKLQKELNENREVKLKTANALWPQKGYPFYEEYLETVRKFYLARIEALDYQNNPSYAVERINAWAAEHTENKIKKVVGWLDPLTRLVLANAIYFKGNWLISFDESRTENGTFYLPDGSSIQTPMMQFHENRLMENKFYYAETSDLKALKLFYSGEDMSMIFLLPKEGSGGIGWLMENIDYGKLENIEEKFEERGNGEIKIPKFEFETKYEMNSERHW